MDPAHALWIGGPPECPVEPLARALAERLGLELYSLDEHCPDHEARLPVTDAQMSLASFVARSRHRFRLVLEDLRAAPEDGPVVVAGAGLFPTSVSAVLRSLDRALFLLPAPDGDWTPIASTMDREARDLRLPVLYDDAPFEQVVDLATEQVGRRDDDPHHESE